MFRVRMTGMRVLALAGICGAGLVAAAEAGEMRGAASSIQARGMLNAAARVSFDLSAQGRVRRGTKLRVYRRGTLGPNAKRECYVRYVQDYRPSGVVIVPRMNCWWVNG